MIGNDVIDLAVARKENNWRRPGFLSKIFTRSEQFLIKDSTDPEFLVWNLWSRKEAAYKIYNRETGIRAFIPLELECFYTNDKEGTVYCRGHKYNTKTYQEKDFLHTIALTEVSNFDLIIPVDKKQIIIKVNSIPFVEATNSKELKPISISHHGRYYQAIGIK